METNWSRGHSPLLASPQGGGAASSKKFRAATESDAAGVVFLWLLCRKPPRLRVQPMLRNIFLIAQPPLLAVMQGGEYGSISNLFTASLSALSKEASQLFL